MSVEAVHWALKQTTDEAVDKLILIAMANYADETHSSWPSRKKLAAAGMCSVDTVDRANRRLEARNLIRKSARTHKGGAHSSNFYELNVEGGWPHHAATTDAAPQPHLGAAPLAAPACGHPSRIGCGHKEPSLEPSLEPAPLPPTAEPKVEAASGQLIEIDLKGYNGKALRPPIVTDADRQWAIKQKPETWDEDAPDLDWAQHVAEQAESFESHYGHDRKPSAEWSGLWRRSWWKKADPSIRHPKTAPARPHPYVTDKDPAWSHVLGVLTKDELKVAERFGVFQFRPEDPRATLAGAHAG